MNTPENDPAAQSEIAIPWAEPGYSIDIAVKELLLACGLRPRDALFTQCVNDYGVLPTRLQIGRAAAASVAAFSEVLMQIAQQRGMPCEKSTIDIQHCELLMMGALAEKVNNHGLFRRMCAPSELRELSRLGILKATPFMTIQKTADRKWIHTHGNFNCEPIQRTLQCQANAISIKRALNQRRSHELEQSCANNGAIAAIVRTPNEWAQHPHGANLLNSPILEVEKIADGAPQSFTPTEGAPLSGIRVLDLTRVLAGPACSRILSQFGADCLKVIAPHLPYYPFFAKIENMGKRSAYLNLKETIDRKKLTNLSESGDVFVTSYRYGALNKYGFGPKQIATNNPKGIIYVSVNCYGPGPWNARPGYDSLAQAATGYAMAHSGFQNASDGKPQLVPMSAPNDYITAYLAALGALAGLQRRAQEGGSFHVKVSLAQTAMYQMKFGYRDMPKSQAGKLQKRLNSIINGVSPSKVDLNIFTLAQRYMQRQHSAFGPIDCFTSPIHFSNPSIHAHYRHPSVPFGTHEACWESD